MNHSAQYLWPAMAILGGCVAAWWTQPHADAFPATSVHVSSSHDSGAIRAAPNPAEAEEPAERVEGRVREIINVPNYTYLRIVPEAAKASSAADDIWAAVATANVEVGQNVQVIGAQRMNDFNSSTLKRTFHTIYFGTLAGAPGPVKAARMVNHRALAGGVDDADLSDMVTTELPPGHPPIGAAHASDVTGSLPHDASDGRGDISPHGAPAAGGDQVPVGKIERASGPLGRTVSEIVHQRGELVGKPVRVRAVIVKSMAGVLGRTFAHVRDGSGDSSSNDHDLTVTTHEELTVGVSATFEGTIVVNKDFGAGYSYPVLLKDARVVDK